MNTTDKYEFKEIRDIKITFRTYSKFSDKLERLYCNKHRAAQMIFENWLTMREICIKEIFKTLSKEELCFIVETYMVISKPNGLFDDIFISSKCLGFTTILKLMEGFNSNILSYNPEKGKIDTKLLKTKLDLLTPIQIFFLEDLFKAYKGDGEIKDYIESLCKT